MAVLTVHLLHNSADLIKIDHSTGSVTITGSPYMASEWNHKCLHSPTKLHLLTSYH